MAPDGHNGKVLQFSRVRGAEGATLPTYGNWMRSQRVASGKVVVASSDGDEALGIDFQQGESARSLAIYALGAASHCGRSCFIVENTVTDRDGSQVVRRVMLDCGIDPLPRAVQEATPDMKFIASMKPDVIVLTHNHADHSGALPYVVHNLGICDVPIVATHPTLDSVRTVAHLSPAERCAFVTDPDTLQSPLDSVPIHDWLVLKDLQDVVAFDVFDQHCTVRRVIQHHHAVQSEMHCIQLPSCDAHHLSENALALTVGDMNTGLRIIQRVGYKAFRGIAAGPCEARVQARHRPALFTEFDPRLLSCEMMPYERVPVRIPKRRRYATPRVDPQLHAPKDGKVSSARFSREGAFIQAAVAESYADERTGDGRAQQRGEFGPTSRRRGECTDHEGNIKGGRDHCDHHGGHDDGDGDGDDDDDDDDDDDEVMICPDAAGLEVVPASKHGSRTVRAPLFGREAWMKVVKCMVAVPFRTKYTHRDVSVTLYPAGHMLGAAMVLVEIGSARVFYTGDYLLRGMTHLPPVVPQYIGRIDALLAESTCGTRVDRQHTSIVSKMHRGVNLRTGSDVAQLEDLTRQTIRYSDMTTHSERRAAVDEAIRAALESDPSAAVIFPARPFSMIDIAVILELVWRSLDPSVSAECPVYVAGDRAKMYLQVLEQHAQAYASEAVRSMLDDSKTRIAWKHVHFVSENEALHNRKARVLLCDHLCASRAVRFWYSQHKKPHLIFSGSPPPPKSFLGTLATNDAALIAAMNFPNASLRPCAMHVNMWEHASFSHLQELLRALKPRTLVLIHGVKHLMEGMKEELNKQGHYVGTVIIPRTGDKICPWLLPIYENPVLDMRPAGIPSAEWETEKAARATSLARLELATTLLGDVVGDKYELFTMPAFAAWRFRS